MDEVLTCPLCGFQSDDLDDWDCIGACNDNLFCQQCHCEFDPDSGKVHKCSKDAALAASERERGYHCEGDK